MLTRFIVAAAICSTALASPPAHAEGYAGAGYTNFDLDDVDLGGLTGRLGFNFHPNFAVEGEAALGINDDEVGPVNVELDNYLGVFGVAKFTPAPNVDVFGRVGFAQVSVDASVGGFSGEGEQDGFAFGGGAQYFFTERLGVRGDYTRLDGDGEDIDALSVSGVVKF